MVINSFRPFVLYLGISKIYFMKRMYKTAIIGLVLIAACSTSKITSSWKADDVTPAAYKKILVLGLINEPDRSIREKMEEHIVGDLQALGYTAVCSCDEFNPKTFENLTEQQALAKLSNSGIDAVLTIVLLDKLKEKHYVPGPMNYPAYPGHHNQFWDYYMSMHGRVYSPGYYVTDTKYFWESNFYDLKKGSELLYSARSQSFEPGSSKALSHEYGQMIVKDMVKQNVLSVDHNEKKLRGF